MTQRRRAAKETAKPRGGGFWIDHAVVVDDDISWLGQATELTLWNVTLPPSFLGRLPRLSWLDVRGGSAETLAVKEARSLKYLAVNQIRGLVDLSDIASLFRLRYLNLYGLAKVSHLPSLRGLEALARADVGQMKTLTSLAPILDAPNLGELHLTRSLNVSQSDVGRIQAHPKLERFGWIAEDVPVKVWESVLNQVRLPRTCSMHPEEWFALNDDQATHT